MLDLSAKSGVIENFLTHDEMLELRKHFLTTTPTNSSLNDTVYGIDKKNVRHYYWFQKTLFAKLQNIFRQDLKLAWAMYCLFTKSFDIHNDNNVNLPEDNAESYVVCLIPFAVNNDPKQCNKASTLIFTKEENPHYAEDHKNYLSNNPIDLVKKFKVKKIHNWNSGDLIWWTSEMDHAGSHFTDKLQKKECWSIHTYVKN